jgi:flagellar biogenesis protein FliO
MIFSSLVLLSASLFATPVYISEVKASREAGHLRVDVLGDGGIDPDAAHTIIEDGQLLIYLGGTKVRSDNRSWDLQDGAGEIRAHRHKFETELVVPLSGNGCDGPVELTGSDTGITALVGCDGAAPGPAPTPARTAKIRRLSVEPKTQEKTSSDKDKLKQLVELPPAALERPVTAVALAAPRVDSAAAAAPVAKTVPATAAAPGGETPSLPEPAPRVAAALPIVAAPLLTAVQTPVPLATVDPKATAAARSPDASGAGSLRTVGVPALVLGALAVAAYGLSRRRRRTIHRHIQILETTSLGPKRSLICARIGDETVILGSSEAGITLLRGGTASMGGTVLSSPSVADAGLSAAPAPTLQEVVQETPEESWAKTIEIEQPLEEALADIPEPGSGRIGGTLRGGFRAIEGGLAGLFGKRGSGGFGRDEATDRFDDLLEDSIEDQELRRKLAAGMSARVR